MVTRHRQHQLFLRNRLQLQIGGFAWKTEPDESQMQAAGKQPEYEEIRRVADMAAFYYVRQKEQLGNGHAVLCAREFIGDEPFAVLWGDDFVYAEPPRARQLLDVYERYGGSVITVFQSTNPDDTRRYGIVKGREVEPGVTRAIGPRASAAETGCSGG